MKNILFLIAMLSWHVALGRVGAGRCHRPADNATKALHELWQCQTAACVERKEWNMLGTILIVILILALLGALPRWPHSRDWGYYPTGGVGSYS